MLVGVAVAVVVVGEGEPETGHVFPRTVVIHDEVALGYCRTRHLNLHLLLRKHKRSYLPDRHTSIYTS